MSPDQQQQTISIEAVARTCNELGAARLVINDLTVQLEASKADLAKHKELLREALERYGPKDGETTDAEPAVLAARRQKG